MKRKLNRIKDKSGLVYLPTNLIKKIYKEIFNSNISQYPTKNNLLHCLKIIYHKQINDYHCKLAYVPTGSDYWREVFGGEYMKYIKPLKEKGFLETCEFEPSYLDEQNGTDEVRIRYRIKPDLLNDEVGITRYLEKGEKAPPLEVQIPEQKYFPKEYNSKHFHLSIDKDAANEWVEDNAMKICNEYLQLDLVDSLPPEIVIPFREFLSGGTYEHRYLTVRKAKHRGIFLGKKLFFFNKEFILAEINEFLEFRKQGIIDHYQSQISVVKLLPLITTRSETNYRLHNSLTNFPNLLLPFLRIFNYPLVQVDLSTSQFTLLANILNIYLHEGAKQLLSLFKKPETKKYLKKLVRILDDHKMILPSTGTTDALTSYDNDVLTFIEDVLHGDFYEKVGDILNIENRGIAKQVTFQMIFRQSTKSNLLIDKLKDHYPIVLSIINAFKKNSDSEEEDSNLAVMLQCIEAEIFIDNILLPLHKKGFPCFSRHDSIVTTKPLLDMVLSEMEAVFDHFNFIHRFKKDDLAGPIEFDRIGFFEREKEKSRYDLVQSPSIQEDHEEEQDKIPDHLIEVLESLSIQDNYSDEFDSDLLEEFASISGLTRSQKNCLEDDVVNLRVVQLYFCKIIKPQLISSLS